MRALCLALVAAGCSDLSVDVTFDVPADYRELTEAVVLDVIAPGEALWECDDLEFGRVDESLLEARRVDRAEVGPDGDPELESVPREGLKLFLARGYNDIQQLVVAGCAAHELIDGEVKIDIEGQPAVYLGTPQSRVNFAGALESLTVGVSDAAGDPLAGVTARYKVVAANGSTPEREASSDEQGTLEMELDQPPWDGPQGVDIDVPWQANQLEPVSGLRIGQPKFAVDVPPAALAQDLPTDAIHQVGRIGPGGEMGLAILGGPDEAGLRRVHLFIHEDGDLVPVVSATPVRASALGLVAGDSRDRVLVIDSDAWHEIAANGEVTSHAGAVGLSGDARRVIALASDCDQGALRDRMVVDDGSGVLVFDGDLDALPSPLAGAGSLVAAGCMLGNGGPYPGVVLQIADETLRIMAEIDDARPATLPTGRRGIAFTPALDGSGPYLLSNRLEADGESIARYSLVRGPGEQLALDVELEDEVAGASLATAGGDFDGDGRLDITGLILISAPDRATVHVFVALGETLEGARLSGLSTAIAIGLPDTQRFSDSQLHTADLDGDGFDELIIARRDGATVFDLVP